MQKFIKLNDDIWADPEKLLESRALILANSGGGKSWAIRRITEQAANIGIQVILLDPEGEFASVREKFDFILCGKGQDVPAETRSAALLAIKLLELGKSAVIDLYELSKQDRQRYVKLFLNAMVDCPKELYHPVLVILDEAHDYAPEGKPSEATQAVEDMASKGRKRGQCLIPASQRISKLSKNVSAECNNKIVGRMSQDIDMKRAGDELGLSKERLTELRQLAPGEFFAFGPAISNDVIKLKIGPVMTSHAKIGYKGGQKNPPASDVIRKVLAELKDLPQEAEKELKTTAELKQALSTARREATELKTRLSKAPKAGIDPRIVDEAVIKAVSKRDKEIDAFKRKLTHELLKSHNNAVKALEALSISIEKVKEALPDFKLETTHHLPIVPSKPMVQYKPHRSPMSSDRGFPVVTTEIVERKIGQCPRAIYSYLATDPQMSFAKTKVAIATGYSQNSGGFNNSISELASSGLIIRASGGLMISGEINQDLLISQDIAIEKWIGKLDKCSSVILKHMLNHHRDETHTKDQIGEATGYSVTSGGFNNSLSELSSLGLIERLPGGMVRINPVIIGL